MSESHGPEVATTPRPLRDGLMQLDPPRLLGSRCGTCGNVMFPVREFCTRCSADIARPPVALTPHGSVYSFTVIRQAPPGRQTPYVLAYIDLDDGVRVMAQLRAAPEHAAIGMRVQLILSPIDVPGGETRLSYLFEPSTRNREVRS